MYVRRWGRVVLEDCVPPPWVGARMSLDEFLELPESKPYLEYTDGLVSQKPSPNATHSLVQGSMSAEIHALASRQRIGMAFIETRFITSSWVPVPDISYYRRERIDVSGGRLPEDFFEPPAIAVEIVSPEQGVTELLKMCLRYIALGTQVALLIDPDPETVVVFRADRPLQLLQGHDRIDLDDVLPGFEMTVGDMFDALLPSWVNDDTPEGSPAES